MCFSVKKTNKQYLIEFVFLIAKTTQNEKLWSYISSMLLWSTGTGCARSSARHSLQGKSWKVIQNSEELIFSSHLLLMALEVKTLPPLSEPQSMTGSYLLPVCFSWTTSILTIQLSIFGGFFLHFMMSGNSTSEFKHWVYGFFVCWLRGLTSRLFFVPHLKVDAFVKLSRDQSIGHNHDQPWDGKQHQQDENVPTETSRKVNSFFCNKEYVLIPKKTRRDHR